MFKDEWKGWLLILSPLLLVILGMIGIATALNVLGWLARR